MEVYFMFNAIRNVIVISKGVSEILSNILLRIKAFSCLYCLLPSIVGEFKALLLHIFLYLQELHGTNKFN